MNPASKFSRTRRSGMTMLLVVFCLLFVVALMSAMLRQFNLAQRQHKQLARKAQAVVLAESAIERAAFALQHQTDYEGESWSVLPEQLDAKYAGQVAIEIDRDATPDIRVSVHATYPALHPAEEKSAHFSKEVTFRKMTSASRASNTNTEE